jgi:hypothetical protein
MAQEEYSDQLGPQKEADSASPDLVVWYTFDRTGPFQAYYDGAPPAQDEIIISHPLLPAPCPRPINRVSGTR